MIPIIIGLVLTALIALVVVCICIRKRRAERLEKAKTYFESLKTDDGE